LNEVEERSRMNSEDDRPPLPATGDHRQGVRLTPYPSKHRIEDPERCRDWATLHWNGKCACVSSEPVLSTWHGTNRASTPRSGPNVSQARARRGRDVLPVIVRRWATASEVR